MLLTSPFPTSSPRRKRGTRQGARRLACLLLSSIVSGWTHADDEQLSSFDLNRQLLAFSDNYQESISETVDEIIAEGVDPASRLLYQTIKVFYTHSAIGIATASDSVHQLLDMMVMLRLQLLTWKTGGHDLSTAEHAARMASRLSKLERNLHLVAGRVFAASEIDRIASLAESWSTSNPDREYIAFVRFQDFEHSEDKAHIQRIVSKGGLFSPISDANRELEETRFTIERALFLANRMPILLEWQSEVFLYRILSSDEIGKLIEQSERISLSSERVTLALNKLPEHFHELVRESSEPVQKIAQNINETSVNLKAIVGDLKPLLEDADSDGEMDLHELEHIFAIALENSREIRKITENLNGFDYDDETGTHLVGLVGQQLERFDALLAERLQDVDNRLLEHRERIYERVFILLVIFCIAFPLSFFLAFTIAKRHTLRYEKSLSR